MSKNEAGPELLDAVPTASREVVEEFLPDDPASAEELSGQIEDYLERIAEERERFEFLNMPLAESIADSYLEVLERVQYEHDLRRYVEAGVRYFVEPDDADDDFSSIIGFDDDRDVLNAIVEELGYEDLVVDEE